MPKPIIDKAQSARIEISIDGIHPSTLKLMYADVVEALHANTNGTVRWSAILMDDLDRDHTKFDERKLLEEFVLPLDLEDEDDVEYVKFLRESGMLDD